MDKIPLMLELIRYSEDREARNLPSLPEIGVLLDIVQRDCIGGQMLNAGLDPEIWLQKIPENIRGAI